MAVPTLNEIKAHLRVNSTSEDSLLEGYLSAAIAFCSEYLSRNYAGAPSLVYRIPRFYSGRSGIALRHIDATAAAVRYIPADGSAETDLAGSTFSFVRPSHRTRPLILPATEWPDTERTHPLAVQITETLATPAPPEPVKHAMILLAAQFFENRIEYASGATQAPSAAIARLLEQYRDFAI